MPYARMAALRQNFINLIMRAWRYFCLTVKLVGSEVITRSAMEMSPLAVPRPLSAAQVKQTAMIAARQ